MSTSGKRTGFLSAGIIVLIVGLLAGAGLLYSAAQREADAVRNLARAPLGCDTTLDFEASGEFFVYIETIGRLDPGIAGDCDTPLGYAWTGSDAPLVRLTLTDARGDDVALDSRTGISYDSDGYVGQSVRSFVVEGTGDHVLRVESPDDSIGFAAAIGRDPADGVGAMRLGGILAALAGLVIGVGLIVVSRRRPAPVADVAATAWPADPTMQWPTAPPGMPVTPPPPPGQPVAGPPGWAPTSPPPPPPGGGAPTPSAPLSAPPGFAVPPTGTPGPVPPGGEQDRSSSTWGVPARTEGPSADDGSTGGGQRSPWAPPDN